MFYKNICGITDTYFSSNASGISRLIIGLMVQYQIQYITYASGRNSCNVMHKYITDSGRGGPLVVVGPLDLTPICGPVNHWTRRPSN